jgi:flavin-dependent dehydrogenase
MLERSSGPGWIAVGDAAASYDPIASRGLVAALESGLAAGELVGASSERLAAYHADLEERFANYLEERKRL